MHQNKPTCMRVLEAFLGYHISVFPKKNMGFPDRSPQKFVGNESIATSIDILPNIISTKGLFCDVHDLRVASDPC